MREFTPAGERLQRQPYALSGLAVSEHVVLCDDDLEAATTSGAADRVLPRVLAVAAPDRVTLPARSWNVVRLTPEGRPAPATEEATWPS